VFALISVRWVKKNGEPCLMVEDSTSNSRIVLSKKEALWVGMNLIKEALAIKKR